MKSNVLSWEAALKKVCNPGLYGYSPGNVPIGEILATLDFKIWAKKVIGINCYFTQSEDIKKFQLTVYCSRQEAYRIPGCGIDFFSCPVGSLYRLKISRHKTGNVYFLSATTAPN
jgi:hypothetical protein